MHTAHEPFFQEVALLRTCGNEKQKRGYERRNDGGAPLPDDALLRCVSRHAPQVRRDPGCFARATPCVAVDKHCARARPESSIRTYLL